MNGVMILGFNAGIANAATGSKGGSDTKMFLKVIS